MLRKTIRTLAYNTLYLSLSNAVQYVLAFFTGVLIARILGADALGVYGLASAVGQIAYRIAELGVPIILTRHFARALPESGRQFLSAMAFRLWAGLLTVVGVEAFALLIGHGIDVQLAIVIYTVGQVVGGLKETALSVYYGHQKIGRAAVSYAIFRVVSFVITVVILLLGLGVVWAIVALLIGQVVSYAYVRAGPERLARRVPLRFELGPMKELLSLSYPLAISGVFTMVNSRADAVILSAFVDNTQLGYYNGAYAVVIGLTLFPTSFMPALYPALSSSFRKSTRQTVRLFLSSQLLTGAVAIVAAVVVSLVAGTIIRLLYGPAFAPATAVLSLLGWALISMYLSQGNINFFNAVDRQKYTLWASVIAGTVNVVANVVLIPRMGIQGAAWATILSESALLLTTLVMVAHLIRRIHDTTPAGAEV